MNRFQRLLSIPTCAATMRGATAATSSTFQANQLKVRRCRLTSACPCVDHGERDMRERRFRVYEEAPGFRPAPRTLCCLQFVAALEAII